jgi:hypothetical protein
VDLFPKTFDPFGHIFVVDKNGQVSSTGFLRRPIISNALPRCSEARAVASLGKYIRIMTYHGTGLSVEQLVLIYGQIYLRAMMINLPGSRQIKDNAKPHLVSFGRRAI